MRCTHNNHNMLIWIWSIVAPQRCIIYAPEITLKMQWAPPDDEHYANTCGQSEFSDRPRNPWRNHSPFNWCTLHAYLHTERWDNQYDCPLQRKWFQQPRRHQKCAWATANMRPVFGACNSPRKIDRKQASPGHMSGVRVCSGANINWLSFPLCMLSCVRVSMTGSILAICVCTGGF